MVGEKCALQVELDLLNQNLAAREENGGRISSQVAELKKHNEDLVQELKTLREKKSPEAGSCVFVTVLGFLHSHWSVYGASFELSFWILGVAFFILGLWFYIEATIYISVYNLLFFLYIILHNTHL